LEFHKKGKIEMTQISPVGVHFGKVRNSIVLSNHQRILETTDRVSAFDVILPFKVPAKGETLQALSLWFFEQTEQIIPNHIIGSLGKNHILVRNAFVIPIEFVMRGVLTGSLWRMYQSRGADFVNETYGVNLPAGLTKNARLPNPILTPTTKAASGHDEPISVSMILTILQNHLPLSKALEIERELLKACNSLFEFGQKLALQKGLELVDTKFEFGLLNQKLLLVDEVLTPDSSRYWLIESENRQEPRQLSKEILREKILEKYGNPENFEAFSANGTSGIDTDFVSEVSVSLQSRYDEMFRYFVPNDSPFQISQKYLVPWPIAPEVANTLTASLALPSHILIVGNGGRDWSLYNFFASQPDVQSIYCAPGNRLWAGAKYRECLFIQPEQIAQFALAHKVGLVLSGPEAPLAAGLWEQCFKLGIPCLGPDLEGVTLETSKVLCKQLMIKSNVPTAECQILPWKNLRVLLQSNAESLLPSALKFDGLAAGKGVVVCQNKADLQTALTHFSENIESWTQNTLEQQANSATKEQQQPMFLVEQMLKGEELSVMALCNGTEFRLLPVARDYKRRNDQQTGPNTGGMGSACPIDLSDKIVLQIKTVFKKILHTLSIEGRPYFGFLFAGVMVDPDTQNVQVIEFNCRLGDPEAQVILPGLGRDFCLELYRTAQKLPFALTHMNSTFFEHDQLKRVYVVGASPEYPSETPLRRSVCTEITRLPIGTSDRLDVTGASAFVPSAIEPDGTTLGGRAFGYLGVGTGFAVARKNAYEGMQSCQLVEQNQTIAPHFRKDIAEELVHAAQNDVTT
jgi:fusion protein PurCD